MKNIVTMPHAMSAGMFGMIMPDRNVPKRWTCTCAFFAPEADAAGAADDVVMVLWSPLIGCG
jgi:hypothetical protein